MRVLAERAGLDLHIDSAGTQGYHIGEAPDRRTQAIAKAYGYDLSQLRARQVSQDDFRLFDLILAMDQGHLATLERLSPEQSPTYKQAQLRLFSPTGEDVPDPYYGGPDGFESVLKMIERDCQALIAQISPA